MSEENKKKEYSFGGVKEFSLEEIEKEILNETVYLDVFAGSDSRFKENVKLITNGLEKVKQIDGVTYNYKTAEFSDYNFSKDNQVGFIAQAVEKVIPEAVKTDEKGFKFVNYQMVIPVILEATKELNEVIEKQSEVIKALEERLDSLEANKINQIDSQRVISKES